MKTLTRFALLLLVSASLSVSSANEHDAILKQEQQLRDFLQIYLKSPKSGVDTSTRYSTAVANLDNGKGKQIVVYVTGNWWCGSGGCMVLVLDPDDATFRIIGRFTIARPPVQVLRHKSMGWHDLSVWMQGGGMKPGHFGVFAFDGEHYPNTPSVTSAESGMPLPIEREGTLLYQ